MPKIVITLLFSICILSSQAQTPDANYQQRYKNAVGLYSSNDFLPAANEFSLLINPPIKNDLVPYSHYYYALSALKLNRFGEGQQMLQQLRDRFPTWNKMDDVNYLSADLAFRQKQIGRALGYLQAINSQTIKQDGEQLEKYYIGQIKDAATLKMLYQQFPYDLVISQTLATLPKTQPTNASQNPAKTKKTGINVAVLFPFKIDDFLIEQRDRNNQFAYDLYDGMKMAQTQLLQEGITLNLTTFDAGNDIKTTADILNSVSFQQSDLVFGPLYSETAKLVADYAETNKKYLILPTAVTNEVLNNRKNTFLTHSTFETQASEIFDFMKIQNATYPKKIAIFYNPTRRDSLLASAFRTKALASGFQVLDYRKTREKIDSTSTIDERNRPSYVFVSSTNDNDGNKVSAMLSKKRLSVPMAVTSSAFDWNKTSMSSISNRNMFLVGNDFIDQNKQQVRDFQKIYVTKRNTIPSVYVMQGYDMMLFYGRMFQKYKTNLNVGLSMQKYDEYLLQGFDYTISNDNKASTYFKLEDARLVTIEK